jgi:uncharacterized OB-fold protein
MEHPIKEGLFSSSESTPSGKPHLIGSRCKVCGYTSFPPKEVCVRCLRDDTMEVAQFGPHATLDSFAVMQVAPPGFASPYAQGYVVLKDGPKVFTLITGCEPRDDALKVGEEMELVIEKIKEDENGNDVIGWKFRPIGKRQNL